MLTAELICKFSRGGELQVQLDFPPPLPEGLGTHIDFDKRGDDAVRMDQFYVRVGNHRHRSRNRGVEGFPHPHTHIRSGNGTVCQLEVQVIEPQLMLQKKVSGQDRVRPNCTSIWQVDDACAPRREAVEKLVAAEYGPDRHTREQARSRQCEQTRIGARGGVEVSDQFCLLPVDDAERTDREEEPAIARLQHE